MTDTARFLLRHCRMLVSPEMVLVRHRRTTGTEPHLNMTIQNQLQYPVLLSLVFVEGVVIICTSDQCFAFLPDVHILQCEATSQHARCRRVPPRPAQLLSHAFRHKSVASSYR